MEALIVPATAVYGLRTKCISVKVAKRKYSLPSRKISGSSADNKSYHEVIPMTDRDMIVCRCEEVTYGKLMDTV